MKAFVITVSDSVYAGAATDRSGPAVREILEQHGWSVECEVLPDEAAMLGQRLAKLAESNKYSLVVTTGGTGIGPRDVTPEATRAVIEREIPGVAEWMRAAGAQKTKYALLSRGVAGTRGRTIILNLPGSPSGAVDSLQAVVDLLPHMVDLVSGKTGHGPREGTEGEQTAT
jgi:molybdenum cofactor synthesis domain-containing protein